MGSLNTNSPASEAITVSAEKVMVRPAAPTERATAAGTSCPAPRSSRKRFTISRL